MSDNPVVGAPEAVLRALPVVAFRSERLGDQVVLRPTVTAAMLNDALAALAALVADRDAQKERADAAERERESALSIIKADTEQILELRAERDVAVGRAEKAVGYLREISEWDSDDGASNYAADALASLKETDEPGESKP